MDQLEAKKLLISRIIAHPQSAQPNVNELLQRNLSQLDTMLENLINEKAIREAKDAVRVQKEELRRASQFDAAWVHALRNVEVGGKKLLDSDANRSIMESLLQPHESPSGSLYSTIATQFPTKFSWRVPQPARSDADRDAEFAKLTRESGLSACEANKKLHRDGVGIEHWAGASQIELQKYREEAALARQKHLINCPHDELRNEARYQSQTEHAAAVQAESVRREQFVATQQAGLYPRLPEINAKGEVMDAKYFRRISTTDYQLFRALVKRHGTSQITARLRGESSAITAQP